jgi:hypothetical protein
VTLTARWVTLSALVGAVSGLFTAAPPLSMTAAAWASPSDKKVNALHDTALVLHTTGTTGTKKKVRFQAEVDAVDMGGTGVAFSASPCSGPTATLQYQQLSILGLITLLQRLGSSIPSLHRFISLAEPRALQGG